MKRAAALLLSVLSPCVAAAAPVDWAATYRSDLDSVRSTFEHEHPGFAPPVDRAMASRMGAAYKAARARSPTDYRGYAYSLSNFIAAIGDTHSFFYVDLQRAPEGWPGFAVARRGARIVVVDRGISGRSPPLGAELVGCDGIGARQLERESLRAFGDARNPALQQWAATYILVEANPARRKPRSCVFRADGRLQSYRLHWSPIEGASFPKLRAAAFGPTDDIGIDEIAPQVYWINLPTFDQSDATTPKLRAVVDAIKRDPLKFRRAKAVIFDVRSNGGGFVSWADELLTALYGKDYLAAHSVEHAGANDWRATPDALRSLQGVVDELRRIGADKDQIDGWNELVSNIRRAISEGKPFYRSGDPAPLEGGGLTRRRPKGAGPFPAHVVFLSDPLCASACLLFADKLLALPGVTHVGAPTGVDGIYTQVRQITTPSGQGKFQMSQVVVRGRPRGDMEFYKPDIPYSGQWTEAAYRRWVLELLREGKLF